MVFAGRGPNDRRTEMLAGIVRKIKAAYDIEVCVSAGLLDAAKAQVLKDAGVDRYNHNLNTSRSHYGEICTTHTFDDRLDTVRAARQSGLEVCSGMIVGMGESADEVVEVARELADLSAQSIPVNFLLPFEGTPVGEPRDLTPEYCLRVLCMFRFVNPEAEVRIAAGREVHLRSLQPLALYPANSLFLEGYLNSKGARARATLQMIKDAGFDIVSDRDLDALLAREPEEPEPAEQLVQLGAMKTRKDLRPTL
jgi:biotin synthase